MKFPEFQFLCRIVTEFCSRKIKNCLDMATKGISKRTFLWSGGIAVLIAVIAAVAWNLEYDRPVSLDRLPDGAKVFLSVHFPDGAPVLVTRSVDEMKVSYEVVYGNGMMLEFRRNGEWKKINGGQKPVPQDIVPQQIKDYIGSNFPGQAVVKMERESKEWEVKLSNRMELTFDSRNFLLMDFDY